MVFVDDLRRTVVERESIDVVVSITPNFLSNRRQRTRIFKPLLRGIRRLKSLILLIWNHHSFFRKIEA